MPEHQGEGGGFLPGDARAQPQVTLASWEMSGLPQPAVSLLREATRSPSPHFEHQVSLHLPEAEGPVLCLVKRVELVWGRMWGFPGG